MKVAEPEAKAVTSALVLCTRAVVVTQSMMASGGNSILLLRPVTFMNTHRVTRTRADNNWLADPNSGQMLEYPIRVRTKPKNRVSRVETYLLQMNFLQPSACSMSSTENSSCKLIRPILATASRLVRARAETHMVMKHWAMYMGTPNIWKKPATPLEKIWNGVPAAGVPSAPAAAPATQRASTAKRLSRTMAP